MVLCALSAILAGARSLRAVGQWADAAPRHTLARLGCRVICPVPGVRAAPSPSTIRRVLTLLDPEALAALTRPESLEVAAVDGKRLRGSAGPGAAAVHLLSVLTPDRGLAAPVVVPAHTSEIDALAPAPADLDLTGVVLTADALHTQDATAAHPVQRGANYLLTIKRNRVRLLAGHKPSLGAGSHPGHRARVRPRAQ